MSIIIIPPNQYPLEKKGREREEREGPSSRLAGHQREMRIPGFHSLNHPPLRLGVVLGFEGRDPLVAAPPWLLPLPLCGTGHLDRAQGWLPKVAQGQALDAFKEHYQ